MEGVQNILDANIVSGIVDIVEQLLKVATTFPLNIFLTCSLIGISIGVLRSLKRVIAY